MLGGAPTYSDPSSHIDALRQHHAVGKDRAFVEAPVTVGVGQPENAVRLVGELLLHLVVRAGRLGDIQSPLFVEVRDDGAIDQRGTGDTLDREAGRHREARRRPGRTLR